MFNIPTFLIERQELTAAASSVTLTYVAPSVSWTPRHLLVRVNAKTARSGNRDTVLVEINDDIGNNYFKQELNGFGSSTEAQRASNARWMWVPTTNISGFGGGEILFPDAFSTRSHKSFLTFSGAMEDIVNVTTGRWASTVAISTIKLTPETGTNWQIGSVFELWVVDESFNIDEQILSGDSPSFDISGIPSQDGDLVQIGNVRSDQTGTGDNPILYLNGDTTNGNYAAQQLHGIDSSAGSGAIAVPRIGRVSAGQSLSNSFGAFISQLTNYSDGSNDRAGLMLSGHHGSSSVSRVQLTSWRWNNTAAITQTVILPETGTNWVTNSMLSTYLVPKNLIERQELSGTQTTITFSNIPQSFDHLELVCYTRNDRFEDSSTIQGSFNGDTTASNYDTQTLQGVATTVSAATSASDRTFAVSTGNKNIANMFAPAVMTFYEYARTDRHKHWLSSSGIVADLIDLVRIMSGRWENTDAITSIALTVASGDDFMAGSTFELRGIRVETNAGDTFTVDGLPQLSGDIVLIGNLRGDRAGNLADDLKYNLNDDATGGNYRSETLQGSGSSVGASSTSAEGAGSVTTEAVTKHAFSPFVQLISNHAEAVNDPHSLILSGRADNNSILRILSSRRNNVEAVKKYKLFPVSGTNFVPGSMLSAYHVPKNVIAHQKLEADAASVTLTIPGGYRDFKLLASTRSDRVASNRDDIFVGFNGDVTDANYEVQVLTGQGGGFNADQRSTRNVSAIPALTVGANIFGISELTVFEYTKTDRHKQRLSIGGYPGGSPVDFIEIMSSRWKNTAAVTSIIITPRAGDNLLAGSIFTVEGIGKDSIGWEDQAVQRGGITAGHGYRVEVDWANTGNMVALSDITADVIELTWEHGRTIDTLFGRVSAGKAVINLRNNSDQFNRFNSGSPFSGNILPGRKVRITDVLHGQVQFSGRLANLQTRVTVPLHKEAQIVAYGIIAELARPNINIPKQDNITTGALIDAALDEAGFTSSDHDIDTGLTTVTKYFKSDKQKALGAIREFELTEAGLVREDHHRDGILRFEDRVLRLTAPHQTPQATFGDGGASGEFGFNQIVPQDPIRLIFNEFVSRVQLFTTQAIATLWTHPEANTSGTAPSILAGDSLVIWASYPNPATVPEGRYVDAWTTPVATTDYLANTQAGGGGTDRTGTTSIAVSKLSTAIKITLTNDHPTDTIFITALKARGTSVFAGDAATVRVEDTASQTAFTQGVPKTWERRAEAKWVPSTSEALDWGLYHLGIFKEPSPTEILGFNANVDLYTSHEAAIRQPSDRITLTLTGVDGTGLGTNEDRFVEKVRHRVGLDGSHRVTYWLSSAAGFSDFWVLGVSTLGESTRFSY